MRTVVGFIFLMVVGVLNAATITVPPTSTLSFKVVDGLGFRNHIEFFIDGRKANTWIGEGLSVNALQSAITEFDATVDRCRGAHYPIEISTDRKLIFTVMAAGAVPFEITDPAKVSVTLLSQRYEVTDSSTNKVYIYPTEQGDIRGVGMGEGSPTEQGLRTLEVIRYVLLKAQAAKLSVSIDPTTSHIRDAINLVVKKH